MRKFLTGAAIGAATLFTATAAMAQPPANSDYGRWQGGYPPDRAAVQRYDGQIRSAQGRVEWLAERRMISGSEYRALLAHSSELRRRLYTFAQDGLSRGERQDIDDRIDNLRDRITNERRDGTRYMP